MESDKPFIALPKTIIFLHPGAFFRLEVSIWRNANHILEKKAWDTRRPGIYIRDEMTRAAFSDKPYIIVNYSEVIASFFAMQVSDEIHNGIYCNWTYLTFFHDDKAMGKKRKKEKMSFYKQIFLKNMAQFPYLKKFTVSYGYTITEKDIRAIEKPVGSILPFPLMGVYGENKRQAG